jgi:hypothetical protein
MRFIRTLGLTQDEVEQDRHSTALDTVIEYKSKGESRPTNDRYLPTYLAQRSRFSHGVAPSKQSSTEIEHPWEG